MKPGDKMRDGTSPDTGDPMYALPADASLAPTFNETTDCAVTLDAQGGAHAGVRGASALAADIRATMTGAILRPYAACDETCRR